MMLSDSEIREILKNGNFLMDKGYIVSYDEYCVRYTHGIKSFGIWFEPYSEFSSVNISFMNVNEVFDVGWIAFVRENIHINPREKMNNVIVLLDYIKNFYEDITNYEFCKESDILIKKYIEENK